MVEEGLVMKEEQIYVPEGELRRVIHLHHDTLVGGHRRRQKTIELVTRNY